MNDLVGTADDRVEPLIGTVAIERGANLILERDTRVVEPSTRRHREYIGDIEGVERVEPAVLIGGAERDRTERHWIARSPEKYAASANNEICADGTEFGARRKVCDAGIERRSEHELVIVPEQLVGVSRLQRYPRGGRAGCRPVDLSQYRTGVKRVSELNAVQAVSRHNIVAEAKQRRVGTRLSAGRIGIHRSLLKTPDMRRAFDRPARRGLDLPRQIEVADAVVCRLRGGVGRAPILLQQLDRHGGRCAEIVIGHTHVEMKLAGIVLVAD